MTEFKPGQMVRCVDRRNSVYLTVGNIYTVIAINIPEYVLVVRDDGERSNYPFRCFVDASLPVCLAADTPSHPVAVPDGLVERLRQRVYAQRENDLGPLLREAADWIESHASAPRVTSSAEQRAIAELIAMWPGFQGNANPWNAHVRQMLSRALTAAGYVLDQPAPVWRHASDVAVGGEGG